MEAAGKESIEQVETEDWRERKNLNQCMLEMFTKGLWTDVGFKCIDHDEKEEVIKAHKNVLAARSPVFQAMFFGPCAANNDVVEVRDKRKEILNLVFEDIYSDSVILKEDNVFAVLEIAHFYQVTSLVQECSDFLATILTSNNACGILAHAIFYKLHSLKDACGSFIDDHTEEVLQTEGFLNLSEDCLLYILKGDTLYAKEEDILEAVEKWARRKLEVEEMNANGTDIRKYLGESFYFLRLPAMTPQVLRESVSRKGYFSIEEYADITAFVSNDPNVRVATNSCIARVPEIEMIDVIDFETRHFKDLRVSFEITMLKSAFLSRIVFGKIHPCLVVSQEIYKNEGHVGAYLGEVRDGESLTKNFDFNEYGDKALKITTLKRSNYMEYYINEMHKVQRLKLPEKLSFNLSENVYVHDLWEQEFKVKVNVEDTVINLTKPLLLEKSSTPYIVDVDIGYRYYNDIFDVVIGYRSSISELVLETRCSTNESTIISESKMIHVRCTNGSFAGIKSIGFKNVSSRD